MTPYQLTAYLRNHGPAPINLDGEDVELLAALRYGHAPLTGAPLRRIANALDVTPREARELCRYAELAHVARRCRMRGDVFTAKDYERKAEKVYNAMPTSLRW